MRPLTFTLLADGPTDIALIPILRWVLREQKGIEHVQSQWADLRRLRPVLKRLEDRIRATVDLFRCDILFVHRDAEKQPAERRYEEIARAAGTLRRDGLVLPLICVVPVRMQEAWLLFDNAALRQAAGNPHGSIPLTLPHLSAVERIPDPKAVLYDLLCTASEWRGRRLKHFKPSRYARLVSEQIADFSPLRALSAFRRLETDVKNFAVNNVMGQ